MEKFETFNLGPTRVAVVDALKIKGVEDPEARTLLQAYIERKKSSQENTSLADAELKLHLVDIYLEAGHLDYALKTLDELEHVDEGDEFKNKVALVKTGIRNQIL